MLLQYRPAFDNLCQQLRETLGPAFEAAWAGGEALDVYTAAEDAITSLHRAMAAQS